MFPQKIHRYIFLVGACSMAFGMMMGHLLTSVPQFILLGNWLIEGDFKKKWQQLRSNKLFWVVTAVFWVHVAGLAWTQDLHAGLSDLQIKLPIFLLAIVFFSSGPLLQNQFYGVLGCFMLGCVCNTVWCLMYNFILHHNDVARDASRFMSHIRLGMYLNMAIACCVYFILHTANKKLKAGLLVLGMYYVSMMLVLGLASGLSTFFILSFISLCVIIYSQKMRVKLISLFVLIVSVISSVTYIAGVYYEQLALKPGIHNALLKQTELGREYIYLDTLTKQKENGNYVWINIQMDELKAEWQRQFPEDSFSYNPAPHNMARFDVLVRYLASKGLNKDSAGIAKLTAEDKRNIKKNITNYHYPHWNFLHKRTYELIYEYDEFINHRSVNGHSLSMRLYFWKAALHVIKQHVIAGVGTGDVQQALNDAYKETASPLHTEWYKRPHNQFLTLWVALGSIGVFILLWSFIYPVIQFKKQLPFLFWPFLMILFISFIPEDTLESQAGLTFYAFFNTLFLSVAWFKKQAEGSETT